MAKKLKTVYQVCPDQTFGFNTIHSQLKDAVKEAQKYVDEVFHEDGKRVTVHVCEIREVLQVTSKRKRT